MHRHPHWFPQLVVRARKFDNAARKFLGLYILEHAVNGCVYPDIHPHRSDEGGTRTTRLSYSDPPLQQISKHDTEIAPLIREVFLPEEGTVWASIDQSQQEFRIAVHYAAELGLTGAQEIVAIYRDDPNTDLHVVTATKIGTDRQTAKSGNYANLYGARAKKFAATLGCSEDEAQAVLDRLARDMPFMGDLLMVCRQQVERDGFIAMLGGARRHFNEYEAKDIPWTKGAEPCCHEEAQRRRRNPNHPWFGARIQRVKTYRASNALIQGTGAHQVKLWMRDLYREGILPRLTLHDAVELFVSSPEEAERAAQIGCDVIQLRVPMRTEIKYGLTWGSAKYAAWGASHSAIRRQSTSPRRRHRFGLHPRSPARRGQGSSSASMSSWPSSPNVTRCTSGAKPACRTSNGPMTRSSPAGRSATCTGTWTKRPSGFGKIGASRRPTTPICGSRW
jgi:hypothetical protein